ncbi:MAG: phosphotransferase [Acidimicrobiales bacterium]
MEPGRLLASGRAADIFDQGDGTVLRRYRTDHNTESEARLVSWLHDVGFPVPAVHHADGGDIVMDHIPGPTMMEDLTERPWRVVAHIRTLARLQRRLNSMAAPPWLSSGETIPPGPALLHLDLHPMNVILSPSGPIVIDWTNARRGPAGFDAAMTYIIMVTFDADGPMQVIGQRVVVGLFRLIRGRWEIARYLEPAGTHRLADPNLTGAERDSLQRLLAGRRHRPAD